MEEIYIDIDRLRCDLIDYYGSATCIFSVAIIDVFEIEDADYDKLIEIAMGNGFSLDNYIIKSYTRKLFK